MKTRTGAFPIGFRRNRSPWQQDLEGLLAWAAEHGFGAIDLGPDAETTGRAVLDAGLRIGSVDLADLKGMISADKPRRGDAIARNAEQVKACAPLGPIRYFVMMLPDDPARARKENFGYLVESYSQLIPVCEAHGARMAIEGWPGPGALCCTPEGYRALFRECSSPVVGINYDPSHLIRMGIEPLQFLREFGDRVHHVHGKDTEILEENLYEFGNLQPATFADNFGFGGWHWRYTIPGHGRMRWTPGFRLLAEKGYDGCVSIELEDAEFTADEAGEKRGLIQGGRFLEGC
jgi:sugar phosphate isomerase/epimerase